MHFGDGLLVLTLKKGCIDGGMLMGMKIPTWITSIYIPMEFGKVVHQIAA